MAWLGLVDQTIDLTHKGLTLVERIEEYIKKYSSSDSSAFVNDLANKIYYDNEEKFNVMVFNLSLATAPYKRWWFLPWSVSYSPDPKPAGVVSYSSHQFRNTTYGVWVFSGSGQWTNLGEFGYHNWLGIGRLKRYDANGSENLIGRIMKFFPVEDEKHEVVQSGRLADQFDSR